MGGDHLIEPNQGICASVDPLNIKVGQSLCKKSVKDLSFEKISR